MHQTVLVNTKTTVGNHCAWCNYLQETMATILRLHATLHTDSQMKLTWLKLIVNFKYTNKKK